MPYTYRVNGNLDLCFEAVLGNGHTGTIVLADPPREGSGRLEANLGLAEAWKRKTLDFTAVVLRTGQREAILTVEMFQRIPGLPDAPKMSAQSFVDQRAFDAEGRANLSLLIDIV